MRSHREAAVERGPAGSRADARASLNGAIHQSTQPASQPTMIRKLKQASSYRRSSDDDHVQIDKTPNVFGESKGVSGCGDGVKGAVGCGGVLGESHNAVALVG